MPGQIVTELILQPLLELLLQVFGYWTSRIVVPALSFGLIGIKDGIKDTPRSHRARPRWHGAQRTDGRIVIDDDTAMFLGLLFWAALGVGVYFLFR